MNKTRVLSIFALAALCLFGQAARGPIFETVPANVSIYENTPGLLPGTTTTIVSGDIWIEEITLVNNSSAAVTVRVRDKQGTPMPIVPDDMSIAAKTVYVIEFKARYSPSGVTWLASDAAAIIGTIRGKRLGL